MNVNKIRCGGGVTFEVFFCSEHLDHKFYLNLSHFNASFEYKTPVFMVALSVKRKHRENVELSQNAFAL